VNTARLSTRLSGFTAAPAGPAGRARRFTWSPRRQGQNAVDRVALAAVHGPAAVAVQDAAQVRAPQQVRAQGVCLLGAADPLRPRRREVGEAAPGGRAAEPQAHVDAAARAVAAVIGVLLKERDDLEGAEAAWRRGDQRGNGPAASNLGLLLQERGDLEGAEAVFARAKQRDVESS
jgi:hypothetical protein